MKCNRFVVNIPDDAFKVVNLLTTQLVIDTKDHIFTFYKGQVFAKARSNFFWHVLLDHDSRLVLAIHQTNTWQMIQYSQSRHTLCAQQCNTAMILQTSVAQSFNKNASLLPCYRV